MLSNCPRCGSSLTIKEAVENCCRSCSHSTAKTTSDARRFHGQARLSVVQKSFDLLVADEMRRNSLTAADRPLGRV